MNYQNIIITIPSILKDKIIQFFVYYEDDFVKDVAPFAIKKQFIGGHKNGNRKFHLRSKEE